MPTATRTRRTAGRAKASRPGALFAGPTTTTATTRVAGYLRASTDEENQPYSLDIQEEKVRAHVASQDDMQLVALYTERASGKDIEGRPELQRLLADAAAGKFDTVVVYKVDRWSRRLADLLATVDFLDRHGVTFRSVTEPIDTTSNLGRMVLQMLGSFAEFERGLIVERVTRGIEAKVAAGRPLTSTVGFGLRVNAEGVVEKDPDTFGVVERIFAEYTTKQRGTKAIAMGLQADGLPRPGSAPWGAAAVARVLRNRTFIGELPFRGDWGDGAHEALLDLATFEAAQRLADQRATPRGAASAKGDFLLSGTISCGRCGAAYAGTSGTSSNGSKVRYYTCTSRRYGKARCDSPSVQRRRLSPPPNASWPATATITRPNASPAAPTKRPRTARKKSCSTPAAGSPSSSSTSTATDWPHHPPTPTGRHYTPPCSTGSRTGSLATRKAIFTALVERLEVHALDDVRPVFRLGGPNLPEPPSRDEIAGQGDGHALTAGLFASHASGWS